MTFSRSVGLAVTAALTLATSTALAQEASPALDTALVGILAGGASIVDFGDIDQDGEVEALVAYTDDCGDAGCLFGIVDRGADGSFAEVVYQYGETPELVSGGTVIDANGVYWTWNGASLQPYHDIYETLEFYPGTGADKAIIVEHQPWQTDLRNYDIQMANIDLVGDAQPERFVWLDGPEYKIGQASPYFVFSDDGEILAQGSFIDRPYLFHLNDRKGAALVSYGGSGFATMILE